MNIIDRIKAPTPAFFAKLRNISLMIAAIGTYIISAPIVVPAIVIKIAGYFIVAGGIGSAVSQVVTPGEKAQD